MAHTLKNINLLNIVLVFKNHYMILETISKVKTIVDKSSVTMMI